MGGRRLGQNFLLDPSILARIVEAGGVGPDDLVIEIGPGLGRMTRMLAERAGRVIAIELDRELARRLAEETRGLGNLEIVPGDCLRYDYGALPSFTVIANIPYYITTPIIFRLIQTAPALRTMVITVQEEVAARMVAPPGTKAYGVLTLTLAALTETERLFPVPRGAFSPPPKVDSAVVRITPLPGERLAVPPAAFPRFRELVGAAFSQRRKTLRNALAALGRTEEIETWLAEAGIDPRIRPERLALGDYLSLFRIIERERRETGSS